MTCNAKCIHCYSDAVFGRGPAYWQTEESLELIDQLADAGIIIIAVSGGEFLLRRDWQQLAQHAVNKGMQVTFATNGLLVTPAVAQTIKDLGIANVSVSLDGASAQVHEAIRLVPHIFEKACAAVPQLTDAGVRVTVNYTPMRPNLSQAEQLIELAYKLGAKKINLTEYVYTTRGGVDLMPLPNELGDLLKRWVKAGELWRGKIEVDWHDCRVALILPGEESDPYKGCGAGQYAHCRITVDHDVTPCVVLPGTRGKSADAKIFWKFAECAGVAQNPRPRQYPRRKLRDLRTSRPLRRLPGSQLMRCMAMPTAATDMLD